MTIRAMPVALIMQAPIKLQLGANCSAQEVLTGRVPSSHAPPQNHKSPSPLPPPTTKTSKDSKMQPRREEERGKEREREGERGSVCVWPD